LTGVYGTGSEQMRVVLSGRRVSLFTGGGRLLGPLSEQADGSWKVVSHIDARVRFVGKGPDALVLELGGTGRRLARVPAGDETAGAPATAPPGAASPAAASSPAASPGVASPGAASPGVTPPAAGAGAPAMAVTTPPREGAS